MCEVHIIAVEGECKEVLFVSRREKSERSQVKIVVAELGRTSEWINSASLNNESWSTYGEDGMYLYEPGPALMKASSWNLLSRYKLKKLGRNSHLFVADDLYLDFPGRCFKIVSKAKVSGRLVKKMAKEGKANLSARNYHLNVPQIQKKYGFQDGGSRYLFFTKANDVRALVFDCVKP